jgi:large subunit ribosomal protein L25
LIRKEQKMAQQVELQVQPREVLGKATKRLRKTGIIPANIYGHNETPTAIQFEADAFNRLLRTRQATGMIDLRTPETGFSQTTLVRQVQRDPRSGKVIHVDFFRVSVHERVTAKVPLRFVGDAPAVKNEGGVVLHLLDALEVEGEAGALPEAIEVDLSPLEQIDDIIHAGAIALPSGFTLVTEASEPVVKVAATRAEKAEETAAATETPAAPTETAGTQG